MRQYVRKNTVSGKRIFFSALCILILAVIFCIAQPAKKKTVSKKAKNTTDLLSSIDPGVVLAKIGGKNILVAEFISRSEYTPRPSYCSRNGGLEKKIILNSLIAEKFLALEAGSNNELAKNIHFQRSIQGRKEQTMRQLLMFAEGTSKVELNASEIKKEYTNAGRTCHIEYFTLPNDSLARIAKQTLGNNDSLFVDVYKYITQGKDSLPTHDVDWNSRESDIVHNALFGNALKGNQVIGPLRVEDDSYLYMRVKGWTDHVAATEKQLSERLSDVKKKLKDEKGTILYEKFMRTVMKNKKLEFDREAFTKLTELMAPSYLQSKKEIEQLFLDKTFDRKRDENPNLRIDNVKIDAIKDLSLFKLDGKIWSIQDAFEEMEKHPLVFRKRKLTKENFAEQLKFAIVDMVRDRYLTNVAYERGYDKHFSVTNNTEMWQDAVVSLWQKGEYLKTLNVADTNQIQVIRKYLNPYFDSLKRKYSDAIEVNVDAFNKINLTSIDMMVVQKNMPFPVLVPSFPQLTTDHQLNYGNKMAEGKK